MARQRRRTEPLETRSGTLTEYAAIEKLLSAGEMLGRLWVLDRSLSAPPRTTPTDHDVLDLHAVMFGDFLAWAGTTRLEDRGPGGKVPVPWHQVRIALRSLMDDLAAWVGALQEIDLAAIAAIIADAHHRFQWIHPFHDTNGRTGRVLDHYLLWVTFELHGGALETSPVIEYFPTDAHEDEYYEGLREADEGHAERLHAYYEERLARLFEAL
jgi:Fic family protein